MYTVPSRAHNLDKTTRKVTCERGFKCHVCWLSAAYFSRARFLNGPNPPRPRFPALSAILVEAVLSDVSITVTDTGRNTVFRTASNATGFYVIPSLPPGNYRLAASKDRLHEYVLDGFPLSTQQKATVNVALELGAVTQKLEVTAESQMLEPSSSTLSAVVENKRIVDLPLNGRNIFSLASLVPGVATARQLTGIGRYVPRHRFIVNGSQEATSAILMDGVAVDVPSNAPTIPVISAIPRWRASRSSAFRRMRTRPSTDAVEAVW